MAELLGASLDSSVRLVIMDALSQAAAEITAALPGSTVEVRLRGRDPEIVVTHAEPAPAQQDPMEAISVESDTGTVRVTLRLPEPLKNAVEDAATRGAVSVNSWLVKAVKQTLSSPTSRRGRTTPTGFAQT